MPRDVTMGVASDNASDLTMKLSFNNSPFGHHKHVINHIYPLNVQSFPAQYRKLPCQRLLYKV